MQCFADCRCEICSDLSTWNSKEWTWFQDESTEFWFRFCPVCVRKAEASLGNAYKKWAHDPMGKRMLARRLIDISGIADMDMDAFTKRRRL